MSPSSSSWAPQLAPQLARTPHYLFSIFLPASWALAPSHLCVSSFPEALPPHLLPHNPPKAYRWDRKSPPLPLQRGPTSPPSNLQQLFLTAAGFLRNTKQKTKNSPPKTKNPNFFIPKGYPKLGGALRGRPLSTLQKATSPKPPSQAPGQDTSRSPVPKCPRLQTS